MAEARQAAKYDITLEFPGGVHGATPWTGKIHHALTGCTAGPSLDRRGNFRVDDDLKPPGESDRSDYASAGGCRNTACLLSTSLVCLTIHTHLPARTLPETRGRSQTGERRITKSFLWACAAAVTSVGDF